MDDQPHRTTPELPEERGRKAESGIQTEIGRGRSPDPSRRRPKPTETKPTEPEKAGTGGGSEDIKPPVFLSGKPFVPAGDSHPSSEEQKKREDPNSDADSDPAPSGSLDSGSDDSDWDHDNNKNNKHREETRGANSKEDDSTQYNEFLLSFGGERRAITNQASFPASENSVECASYNHSLSDLISCLRRSNTEWVSIDCLGRKWALDSKELKIRTTVVVTFSRYPDRAEDLRRDLRMAIRGSGLPIEFIEGRVVSYGTNPFGLLEPQIPLICGSSCVAHGVSGAGTVGGFVTIAGDPDPNAVYAVTNHHVVTEEEDDPNEIPWTTEQNIESHLGLTEQQSEDLADLNLNREYGDDRKSYLQHFVRQFSHHWNQRHPDNRIRTFRRRQICASVNQRLAQFNVPSQRTALREGYRLRIRDHGLEDFESSVMEDMRWFLSLHYYELQIPLQIIDEFFAENAQSARALFKDVIRIRRLWRQPPSFSRIIEHPEKGDMDAVTERFKSWIQPTEGEPSLSQEEIAQLTERIGEIKAHASSAERLIGTVWASSGIGPQKWIEEGSPPLREDWALIKLFRGNGQVFENTFSANLLRPGFPEDRFHRVRDLLRPARIDVTKRGRTTDLTVGKVNGAESVFRELGHEKRAFSIIATSTSGQLFSAFGDSGSWIMDRTGQLVGMMWGGRTSFFSRRDRVELNDLAGYEPQDLEVQDVTYFTPASYFFKWIGQSFEEAMDRFGHTLEPGAVESRVRLFS
ncbi:hypothetical protein AK830_g10648 [Neonectria ditissima]|uniref:Uncharacterized protein n=1 Tax=Neonectria ditissima TaxID=78410 RepID=A0A0P7AF94_9HYPO|nr:hypothetical protein AK830_g10648 [Neonectria ditissima]